MRLLVINHAGDVRDAYRRLHLGGPETYYAQRYSVSSYAGLLDYADEVAVVVRVTEERYDEVLPNGVRAIGCGPTGASEIGSLVDGVRAIAPTHVVLGTPDRHVIRWLTAQRYRCLAAFSGSIPNADGSPFRKVLTRARNAMVAFHLNQECFEWVGSYGVGSCRKLVEAGVDANKVIPWDFLVEHDSGNLPVKALRAEPAGGYRLCYVGSIQPEKGVGDLIEAVAHLKSIGFPVRAAIVGVDGAGYASDLVRRHGVADEVDLVGLVPNDRIEPLMHESDVVVVPSHPEYPEGFPLVIHHALRARTPIVASDHPMFRAHLRAGRDALLFPAKNAQALADGIYELLTDPELVHAPLRPLGSHVAQAAPGREVGGPRAPLGARNSRKSSLARPAHPRVSATARPREQRRLSPRFGTNDDARPPKSTAARLLVRDRPSREDRVPTRAGLSRRGSAARGAECRAGRRVRRARRRTVPAPPSARA